MFDLTDNEDFTSVTITDGLSEAQTLNDWDYITASSDDYGNGVNIPDADHSNVTYSGSANASFIEFVGGKAQVMTEDVETGSSDHVPTSASVKTALDLKVDTADKGAANGVAPLNSSGLLDNSYLSVDVMNWKGAYDANANSPDLTSSYGGSTGDVYRVSVAGTQDLDGSVASADLEVGDQVIWNGSTFDIFPLDTNLTNAEVKTAYEANADTNAFTDADESKLDGIESGATADQTGAEMVTAINAESDANIMTDAQVTKLGHISVSGAVNLDNLDSTAANAQQQYHTPTITSAATAPNATAGDNISYQATSSFSGVKWLMIDADGTGVSVDYDTGSFFGGSSATAGSYTIKVRCASLFGVSAEQSISWTVS